MVSISILCLHSRFLPGAVPLELASGSGHWSLGVLSIVDSQIRQSYDGSVQAMLANRKAGFTFEYGRPMKLH